MSGMWSGRAIIVLGVVLVGVSLPAWGVDYSFTGVGVLTGDATSKALGVSRNGNYVTGDSGTGLDADGNTINPEAFIYNTALGSKVGIGFPPGWTLRSLKRKSGNCIASSAPSSVIATSHRPRRRN